MTVSLKAFDSLYQHVQPYAPGCARLTIQQHLRNAAMMMCQRSRLWRYSDEFSVSEGSDALLISPDGGDIMEIEFAKFDGTDLEIIDLVTLNERMPDWQTAVGSTPRYITQVDVDSVLVVPSMAGTLHIDMFLTVADDATQLPQFLVDKYSVELAAGALANILMLPDKKYTNPTMAGVFQTRFENALNSISGGNIKGQQRAPVRTKANFF